MAKQVVKDENGKVIELTNSEKVMAAHLQLQCKQFMNAIPGFDIDITTLTTIIKKVTEQKFYEIPFAKYLPVRVGNGAWSQQLTTYVSYQVGGDFETGLINTGSNNDRLASVSTGVTPVNVPIKNWAKQYSWSLFDVAQASKAGNWDLISSLERSRKTNWDLGLQSVAFLGSKTDTTVKGLLTQSDVTSNTALITANLNSLSEANFTTFVAGVVGAYRTNAEFTAYPDTFIIPETDYNGLVTPYSSTFPNISRLDYLKQAFKTITMNQNFEILPLAYANKLQNADISGLNKNRYVLYRQDEESIRMDVPVDYTATMQNTINGFQYQNVAYGQFTGAKAYRPKEMLYFDWT